jgi:outer membrane protein
VNTSLYRYLLTAICIAMLCGASSSIAGEQLKIGYVDSDVIIKDLPEAQAAQQQLQDIVKGWQDELDTMSKDLQAKYEDYQKKQALYNDATKQSEQQKLVDEEQKVNQFREEKFGAQGELAAQRDKIMAPIREKILKAIEVVAKQEKVSFMFDKAGDVLLLYAEKQADYTYKVLDQLKRGSTK